MNVKIISNANTDGTTVVMENGSRLLGITRVHWSAAVGDFCRAEVELMQVSAEVEGRLTVVGHHPVEGDMREIAKIVYSDGSEWIAI